MKPCCNLPSWNLIRKPSKISIAKLKWSPQNVMHVTRLHWKKNWNYNTWQKSLFCVTLWKSTRKGSTVIQWFALLPLSMAQIQLCHFCVGCCMGFLPKSRHMHVRWTGYSKLTIGMTESMYGSLSHCCTCNLSKVHPATHSKTGLG